jgi:hypothetical protein
MKDRNDVYLLCQPGGTAYMSEFLENLRIRFAESQKRFVAKQAQLNAVNAEFQAVAQEFNAWQTLLNLETRKEQMAATTLVVPATTRQIPNTTPTSAPPSPLAPSPNVNKTEIVRELLRQHSAGMTPSELWKQEQIKAQFPHRPYLYSVLKRLKDRGDIAEKRGKYFFKFSTKPDDAKEQGLVQ